MAPCSTLVLAQCMGVNRAWRAVVRQLATNTVVVSALDCRRAARTSDSSMHKLLCAPVPFSCPLLELHLHGLTAITDAALGPLRQHARVRLVGLTFCRRLTTGIRAHLPASVRELHVLGCPRMYGRLGELDDFTLDIHVCELGLQAVEEQAFGGFRFVDAAFRAGIRRGSACACGATNGGECATVTDLRGEAILEPEVWHASSFDWGGFVDMMEWEPAREAA